MNSNLACCCIDLNNQKLLLQLMGYFQFGPALGYLLGEAQIQPGKNLKNSDVLECLNLLNREVML
jgi:hypothetical protein